jgi:hypothetical protein
MNKLLAVYCLTPLCRPNIWSAEFYVISSYVNVYLTCKRAHEFCYFKILIQYDTYLYFFGAPHACSSVTMFWLVSVRIRPFVTYFDSCFMVWRGTLICPLQFSYAFAILICVCNCHVGLYCSYVDVCNSHMRLQFSRAFAILISGSPHNFVTYIGIVLTLGSKGGVHYNLQIVWHLCLECSWE